MTTDRLGNKLPDTEKQDAFLRFCYRTIPGRILLKLAKSAPVTHIVGAFMDSRLSAGKARRTVRKLQIDLSDYEQTEFPSFNAYFTRKRKQGVQPVCTDADAFCSPADSRLTVVPLQDGTAFPVKQAPYTVGQLLQDEENAKRFYGGYALVFRLCVEDYHRYAYPADGKELSHKYIGGELHTVNPIALEQLPVFHRNCREVTWMDCGRFGRIACIEVGAMLVGKIVNHHKQTFVKGEEKGYFAFGGSTVVLLVEKDAILIDEDLLRNSKNGIETYVRSGEKVGRATK